MKLAAFVLLGPLLLRSVAQTVPSPDPVQTFAPLGVSGIVCSILFYVWRQEAARRAEAEQSEKMLGERVYALLERALPLLADSARVAAQTKTEPAQVPSAEQYRLEQTLAGIERALDAIRRRDP